MEGYEIKCEELGFNSRDIETETCKNVLNRYKIRVNLINSYLKSQIEKSKYNYLENNIKSDYDWILRVKLKSKLYSSLSNSIQSRISHLNKAEKDKKQKSIDHIFVDKCREMLSDEMFFSILEASEKTYNEAVRVG